jgi:hypothetical protein
MFHLGYPAFTGAAAKAVIHSAATAAKVVARAVGTVAKAVAQAEEAKAAVHAAGAEVAAHLAVSSSRIARLCLRCTRCVAAFDEDRGRGATAPRPKYSTAGAAAA